MRTLLLRFIHYVISLGQFLYGLLLWLPVHSLTWKKPSLEADRKLLKKVPAHVGFLVLEEDFSFRDLANLIVWSVTLGVSYISVYDFNGEVKRNSLLLQQNIRASKEQVLGQDLSSCDIQIFSSSHPVLRPPSALPKTHGGRVHLLCVDDGRKNIVQTARHLSQMVAAGMYRLEDIQPSIVDSMIQESRQLPDPDLCLKFGALDSLLGYLPWHIRLSEIISLSSHKGITYKSFLSALIEYGNTDQRFGK
ncbi:unnamed protein product [Candidula unifasciata]|uniref:ditrans,polycis-polyprenyl diphosphate synthase [(2E,6E)-farnesyldiphosphate specific] n=1 Tax=Candidula unifasciata TaxID=100452 RepID=A0A8S3YSH7_9EUPU|nr:unnamed protein product [Candidula unifasciata]